MKNKNLLVWVILLTILVKVLEIIGTSYLVKENLVPSRFLETGIIIVQIVFIVLVALILFFLFDYLNLKKRIYLIIPALAFFIKELFNFIFVYNFAINAVTLIGLIVEPVLILGFVWVIDRYIVKFK